jgi:hypothetical protein
VMVLPVRVLTKLFQFLSAPPSFHRRVPSELLVRRKRFWFVGFRISGVDDLHLHCARKSVQSIQGVHLGCNLLLTVSSGSLGLLEGGMKSHRGDDFQRTLKSPRPHGSGMSTEQGLHKALPPHHSEIPLLAAVTITSTARTGFYYLSL